MHLESVKIIDVLLQRRFGRCGEVTEGMLAFEVRQFLVD
jgi:hypothetical protein